MFLFAPISCELIRANGFARMEMIRVCEWQCKLLCDFIFSGIFGRVAHAGCHKEAHIEGGEVLGAVVWKGLGKVCLLWYLRSLDSKGLCTIPTGPNRKIRAHSCVLRSELRLQSCHAILPLSQEFPV